jgi:nickel transport protein
LITKKGEGSNMMRHINKLAIIFAFMFLSNSPARAHDLWLAKEGSTCTLCYGHMESKTGEQETIKYDPQNILKVQAFDLKGNEVQVTANKEYPFTISEVHGSVVYALTSSGYWTKTPHGTKNVPKNKTDMPVSSWLSYESVKRIDQWADAFSLPLTEDLEITPLENPIKLKKGKKIHLLVTFKGEPIEGVVVSYFDRPRGTSNSDGKINIRLKNSGLQLISASYKQKIQSEKADEIVYTTFLNFEVK